MSKRKNRKQKTTRRLGVEQLDKRVMLDASGLGGALDGHVAVDLNNSGTVDTGELIAGAQVKIVLDDGDGVYDSNSDTLISTLTTDSDGYYRIDGLADGDYFAIQCAGTFGGFELTEMVSPAKSIGSGGQPGTGLDTFDVSYGPVVDALPSGTPNEQNFTSATALGGEIDLTAHAVSGIGSDQAAIETDNGLLQFSSEFNATGEWSVVWDGVDGAGAGVDPTGLGGIDLTDIGGTSGAASSFAIGNLQVDATGVNNTTVTIRVYSGSDVSEITVPVTSTDPTDYCLDFSSFSTVSGAGADFTNVGAVELIVTADVNGVDGQLDSFGTFGVNAEYCPFLNPVPGASIGIEKFTNGFQADNPGDADVPSLLSGSTVTWTYVVTNDGGTPITNVTVTDAPQGAVTTITSMGNGDTTLDVDESWTYELTGLAISGNYGNSGTVNGDALGTPVSDVDTSNYIGVANADLVTVKTLTSGDSTPDEGDTVTFEITITNDGPNTATNVELIDLLPSGLTPTSNNGNGGLLGTYDPATGSWTISSLADGETATLVLEGTVDVGQGGNTITNTTTAATSDQPDPSTNGDDLEEEVTVNVVAAPNVDIEKFINGNQADSPGDADVPTVNVGDTINIEYVVTNPGNVPLTNVVVQDSDLGTITNLVSGDTDGDGELDTNETWVFEATSTAVAGTNTCTATVTTDEGVSDADDSNYVGEVPAPSVDIEKLINGNQADNPGDGDVPTVNVGDTITIEYVVTNPGDVPLTNVVVQDSDLGTITNLVSGDTDGDGELDTNETWVFEATTTAVVGTNTCTATVTTDEGVSDADDSNYVGVNGAAPAVDIEKLINGNQADNPGDGDVPTVNVGDTITIEYVVTNPGNVPLTNVVVQDTDLGTITNLVSGDTDGDGELDTNETWVFEATTTAVVGTNTCTATVTTDEGVSDADDSNYVGVNGAAPAVDIEKLINGNQADNPGDGDVPTVNVGDTITIEYVVTNPGNVPLTNVVVQDSDLGTITNLVSGDTDGDGELDTNETWVFEATTTAVVGTNTCTATVTTDEGVSDADDSNYVGVNGAAPAVDIEKLINGNQADNPGDGDVPTVNVGDTITIEYVVTNPGNVALTNVVVQDSDLGTITNLVSGDTDGDGELDTNETWVFEATTTAVVGTNTCTATVTTDEGVSDADDSNYVGVNGAAPAVDIEKLINGNQADSPGDADVPTVNVGDAITVTYEVTNPGNIALTNVVVTDSDLGTITNLVSGDTDGDGELDTNETWVFEATTTAVVGTNTCTATVTTDEGVSDADDSNYVGVNGAAPAVDIEKLINGNQADNPGDGDVPTVNVGDTITIEYVVTNPGNVALTNVVVQDSDLGTITNLVSGDTDGDGELDTNETWVFEATATAVAGTNTCTATVTTDEGVSDADDSNYVGAVPAPAVDIEKFINGNQADNPGDGDVPAVTVGDTITVTYEVTNPGNVPLTNVVVTDSDLGTITNLVSGDTDGDGELDTNETWVFEATTTAVAGTNTCTATVTTDEGVSDADDSNYVGAAPAPAVDIEKLSNGQQADLETDADVPVVLVGDSVTLTYVVTNPGNTPLTNVVVTDSVAGVITNLVSGDTNGDGNLDTNETWVFEAVATAALGLNECTATVTTDQGVTDLDESHFVGSDANINVVKQVLGTPVAVAADPDHFEVTYEATIKNSGPVTLTGLDLFDDVNSQFNGAFVSVISAPVITGHTLSSAANLPTINGGWATDVTQSMFNDDGTIAPGETITLQFVVEVDAVVAAGNPVNNQIQVVADDPINGGEFGPLDFSDDGNDNDGENPGFPGDTGGGDDPSPVLLPFAPLGEIHGAVFVDANNNGQFDAGETPIAGVEIMLSGNGVAITDVTDANGEYDFINLAEGNYTLMEIHPVAFLDGQEQLGDFGGQSPEDDKFEVALFAGNGADPAGLAAFEYNFGELGADPRLEGKSAFLTSNIAAAGGVTAAASTSQSAAEATVPMLVGDTLVVTGTGGIDEVVITAGSDVHRIDVNGVVREFSAERYQKIRFDGSTGDDRVTLVGSEADDRAVLRPFEASIKSESYEISVENARYISATGGGGIDDAFLVDGAGDDVFLGASAYASMRDVANEYKNELRGFEKLIGNAVMGGNDTAVIYDSWQDDAFLSVPGYSQMIGGDYEVRANKFELIEARANAGGHDVIEFRDSAGDDVFATDGHRSTFDFGTGFRTTATGFESSDVLSRDGDDVADVLAMKSQSLLRGQGKFAYVKSQQNEFSIRSFDRVRAEAEDGEELDSQLSNIDFVFERLGE